MFQEPPELAHKILQRSDAAIQLQYLQTAMADEKRRRQEFREWITEDVKAEFINGEMVIHSPVRRRHWKSSDFLSRLLSYFASFKKML